MNEIDNKQKNTNPPFQERKFQIPSEYSFVYNFKGIVHPQRASVQLYDLGIAKINCITADTNFSGFLEIVGQDSEIWARFHFDQEINDLPTLRNLLKSHVDARIDLLSFIQGAHYSAEIVSCTPLGGDEMIFGVELRAIKELSEIYTKRVKPQELFKHECFPYLSLAINDFKNAMQSPDEASYLAYRAIESLGVYYADVNKIDLENGGRKKSWELLRLDLKYEKEDFDIITERAKAKRHGQRLLQNEQEYLADLKLAWEVIYRFMEARFEASFVIPPS